jgi:hypothetical protein
MDKELKIPAIGEYVRNIGKLLAVETIQPPPPPPYTEYIFEEINARVELRLGDEVIDKIEELNDFYGLNTSVETAIGDAQKYTTKRNLTDKSELEVVVVKIIKQIRMNKLDREAFFSNSYFNFEYTGKYYPNDPAPVETVIWSSKHQVNKSEVPCDKTAHKEK